MQLKGIIFLLFYFLIPVAIGGYCGRHNMGIVDMFLYILLPYLAVVNAIHYFILKKYS
jgi:hypothetical protein